LKVLVCISLTLLSLAYIIPNFALFVIGPVAKICLVPGYRVEMVSGPHRPEEPVLEGLFACL
jgi:hypothetical protein